MKNMWADSYVKKEISTPKEIVQQQAKLLPQITGDLVYAEVVQITENIFNKKYTRVYDFNYSFVIKGKFLNNYKYTAFWFRHDIKIYPVIFDLDTDIKKELGLASYVKANDETEFMEILENILKSQTMSDIVTSIMNLSK